MYLKPVHLRTGTCFLLVVVLTTQVLFAHMPQTTVWDSRRKPVQLARSSLVPATPAPATPAAAPLTQFGSIRSQSKSAPHDSRRTIIHIQDIHQNEEAQANIAGAIKSLAEKGELGFLALEGTHETIDLTALRRFPHPNIVRQTADYFLRTHQISGPIHAALTSAKSIPVIVGLEDPVHYEKNIEAYRRSAPRQAEERARLVEWGNELEAQKLRVFNPDLLAFDQQVHAYRKGELKLGEYLGALAAGRGYSDSAPELVKSLHPNIRPPATETQIAIFLKSLKMERELNFSRIESERSRLLATLMTRSSPAEAGALLQLTDSYRAGRINTAGFYAQLREQCNQHKISLDRTPALATYLEYIQLTDQINADELFREAQEGEAARYRSLCQTDQERELVQKSRSLYLVQKLVDFSLTPQEWGEYSRHPGLEPGSGLSSFIDFYQQAELRDQLMARKFLDSSVRWNDGMAVLVTGGFHSKGIDAALTAAGINVVSFVPKITKLDIAGGSTYLTAFAQEKTPIQKLFEGKKLFLARNPAAPDVRRLQMPAAMIAGLENLNPQLDLSPAEEGSLWKQSGGDERFELSFNDGKAGDVWGKLTSLDGSSFDLQGTFQNQTLERLAFTPSQDSPTSWTDGWGVVGWMMTFVLLSSFWQRRVRISMQEKREAEAILARTRDTKRQSVLKAVRIVNGYKMKLDLKIEFNPGQKISVNDVYGKLIRDLVHQCYKRPRPKGRGAAASDIHLAVAINTKTKRIGIDMTYKHEALKLPLYESLADIYEKYFPGFRLRTVVCAGVGSALGLYNFFQGELAPRALLELQREGVHGATLKDALISTYSIRRLKSPLFLVEKGEQAAILEDLRVVGRVRTVEEQKRPRRPTIQELVLQRESRGLSPGFFFIPPLAQQGAGLAPSELFIVFFLIGILAVVIVFLGILIKMNRSELKEQGVVTAYMTDTSNLSTWIKNYTARFNSESAPERLQSLESFAALFDQSRDDAFTESELLLIETAIFKLSKYRVLNDMEKNAAIRILVRLENIWRKGKVIWDMKPVKLIVFGVFLWLGFAAGWWTLQAATFTGLLAAVWVLKDRNWGNSYRAGAKAWAKYWAPHLHNTQVTIRQGLEQVKNREAVTILGSNNGLDLPLEELARAFNHVNLVDLDEDGLRQARDSLPPDLQSKINLVTEDATALNGKGLKHLIQEANAIINRTPADQKGRALVEIVDLYRQFQFGGEPWRRDLQANYVLSTNLSSQLEPFSLEEIKNSFKEKFHMDLGGFPEYEEARWELVVRMFTHHGQTLGGLLNDPDGRICFVDSVAISPHYEVFGRVQNPQQKLREYQQAVNAKVQKWPWKEILNEEGKEFLRDAYQAVGQALKKNGDEVPELSVEQIIEEYQSGQPSRMVEATIIESLPNLFSLGAIDREDLWLDYIYFINRKAGDIVGNKPYVPLPLHWLTDPYDIVEKPGMWHWVMDPPRAVRLEGGAYSVVGYILKPKAAKIPQKDSAAEIIDSAEPRTPTGDLQPGQIAMKALLYLRNKGRFQDAFLQGPMNYRDITSQRVIDAMAMAFLLLGMDPKMSPEPLRGWVDRMKAAGELPWYISTPLLFLMPLSPYFSGAALKEYRELDENIKELAGEFGDDVNALNLVVAGLHLKDDFESYDLPDLNGAFGSLERILARLNDSRLSKQRRQRYLRAVGIFIYGIGPLTPELLEKGAFRQFQMSTLYRNKLWRTAGPPEVDPSAAEMRDRLHQILSQNRKLIQEAAHSLETDVRQHNDISVLGQGWIHLLPLIKELGELKGFGAPLAEILLEPAAKHVGVLNAMVDRLRYSVDVLHLDMAYTPDVVNDRFDLLTQVLADGVWDLADEENIELDKNRDGHLQQEDLQKFKNLIIQHAREGKPYPTLPRLFQTLPTTSDSHRFKAALFAMLRDVEALPGVMEISEEYRLNRAEKATLSWVVLNAVPGALAAWRWIGITNVVLIGFLEGIAFNVFYLFLAGQLMSQAPPLLSFSFAYVATLLIIFFLHVIFGVLDRDGRPFKDLTIEDRFTRSLGATKTAHWGLLVQILFLPFLFVPGLDAVWMLLIFLVGTILGAATHAAANSFRGIRGTVVWLLSDVEPLSVIEDKGFFEAELRNLGRRVDWQEVSNQMGDKLPAKLKVPPIEPGHVTGHVRSRLFNAGRYYELFINGYADYAGLLPFSFIKDMMSLAFFQLTRLPRLSSPLFEETLVRLKNVALLPWFASTPLMFLLLLSPYFAEAHVIGEYRLADRHIARLPGELGDRVNALNLAVTGLHQKDYFEEYDLPDLPGSLDSLERILRRLNDPFLQDHLRARYQRAVGIFLFGIGPLTPDLLLQLSIPDQAEPTEFRNILWDPKVKLPRNSELARARRRLQRILSRHRAMALACVTSLESDLGADAALSVLSQGWIHLSPMIHAASQMPEHTETLEDILLEPASQHRAALTDLVLNLQKSIHTHRRPRVYTPKLLTSRYTLLKETLESGRWNLPFLNLNKPFLLEQGKYPWWTENILGPTGEEIVFAGLPLFFGLPGLLLGRLVFVARHWKGNAIDDLALPIFISLVPLLVWAWIPDLDRVSIFLLYVLTHIVVSELTPVINAVLDVAGFSRRFSPASLLPVVRPLTPAERVIKILGFDDRRQLDSISEGQIKRLWKGFYRRIDISKAPEDFDSDGVLEKQFGPDTTRFDLIYNNDYRIVGIVPYSEGGLIPHYFDLTPFQATPPALGAPDAYLRWAEFNDKVVSDRETLSEYFHFVWGRESPVRNLTPKRPFVYLEYDPVTRQFDSVDLAPDDFLGPAQGVRWLTKDPSKVQAIIPVLPTVYNAGDRTHALADMDYRDSVADFTRHFQEKNGRAWDKNWDRLTVIGGGSGMDSWILYHAYLAGTGQSAQAPDHLPKLRVRDINPFAVENVRLAFEWAGLSIPQLEVADNAPEDSESDLVIWNMPAYRPAVKGSIKAPGYQRLHDGDEGAVELKKLASRLVRTLARFGVFWNVTQLSAPETMVSLSYNLVEAILATGGETPSIDFSERRKLRVWDGALGATTQVYFVAPLERTNGLPLVQHEVGGVESLIPSKDLKLQAVAVAKNEEEVDRAIGALINQAPATKTLLVAHLDLVAGRRLPEGVRVEVFQENLFQGQSVVLRNVPDSLPEASRRDLEQVLLILFDRRYDASGVESNDPVSRMRISIRDGSLWNDVILRLSDRLRLDSILNSLASLRHA